MIYREILSGHRHLKFMELPLLAIVHLCGQGQPHEDKVPVATYYLLALFNHYRVACLFSGSVLRRNNQVNYDILEKYEKINSHLNVVIEYVDFEWL